MTFIDNSIAVSDEEITQALKLKYGKENLKVKTREPPWFQQVEEEVLHMEKTRAGRNRVMLPE